MPARSFTLLFFKFHTHSIIIHSWLHHPFKFHQEETIGDITDVRSQIIRDWLKTVDFKLDDAAIDASIKPRLQAIFDSVQAWCPP